MKNNALHFCVMEQHYDDDGALLSEEMLEIFHDKTDAMQYAYRISNGITMNDQGPILHIVVITHDEKCAYITEDDIDDDGLKYLKSIGKY